MRRPIIFVCPWSSRFWVVFTSTFASTGNGAILSFSPTSALLVAFFFAIALAAQLICQLAENSLWVWNLDTWFFGWWCDLRFTFLFFGFGSFR